MHRKLIIYRIISLVLSAFVSHVCPYDIPDPVIQMFGTEGFFFSVADLPDIFNINLSAFLISNDKSEIIVQNATVELSNYGWWNYRIVRLHLMPGQTIRFRIHVDHKEFGKLTLFRNYKIPMWPLNTMADTVMCKISQTTVQGRKVCAGALIFEDNFDLLSTAIWAGEYRIPLDVDDADFAVYRSNPTHGYTQNDHFHVRPIVTDEIFDYNESKVRTGQMDLGKQCTGIFHREQECKRQAQLFRILPPIVSARINTKESFSFRYGKIEIRARLPKGDWLFPLITLEPRCPDYGVSGHSSGQMRIAFIHSNEHLQTKDGQAIDGSHLFGGVVINTGESGRNTWLRSVHGPEHWGNDFHTYTLTWTNSLISLEYDGTTYATLSGGFYRDMKSRLSPFDKEFYISVGVSAGGRSDFPDGSVSGTHEKPWNNTDPKNELRFYNARHKWRPTWKEQNHHLMIDHIKVWAL